jgi:hypothetical protein
MEALLSKGAMEDEFFVAAPWQDEATLSPAGQCRLPIRWLGGALAAKRGAQSLPASELDRCWVSMSGERLLGAVRVVRTARHVAEVTLFRIDPECQHTAIVPRLIRNVHEYCREQGCLKVIVEAGVMPAWMLAAMGQFGFLFLRQSRFRGRQLCEFRRGV